MENFTNHPLYGRHNIDSLMSSLWSFYRGKFLVLIATSFIMSLIIQYISSSIDVSELQSITDPSILLEKIADFIYPILIITAINLLFTTFLHYYIIYSPLDESLNIFGASFKSTRFFIPYLIIIVLVTFAGSFLLALGLMVFIVGVIFSFLYIFMLYLFILPILMVEGPMIGRAISRTVKLGHRNFWTNIGWTSVVIIILMVLSVFLSAIVLIPFSGSFLKIFTNPEEAVSTINIASNPVYLILSALANALYYPLLPIFAVILYFNAVAREEKIDISSGENTDPGKITVDDLYSKTPDEKQKNQESSSSEIS